MTFFFKTVLYLDIGKYFGKFYSTFGKVETLELGFGVES